MKTLLTIALLWLFRAAALTYAGSVHAQRLREDASNEQRAIPTEEGLTAADAYQQGLNAAAHQSQHQTQTLTAWPVLPDAIHLMLFETFMLAWITTSLRYNAIATKHGVNFQRASRYLAPTPPGYEALARREVRALPLPLRPWPVSIAILTLNAAIIVTQTQHLAAPDTSFRLAETLFLLTYAIIAAEFTAWLVRTRSAYRAYRLAKANRANETHQGDR